MNHSELEDDTQVSIDNNTTSRSSNNHDRNSDNDANSNNRDPTESKHSGQDAYFAEALEEEPGKETSMMGDNPGITIDPATATDDDIDNNDDYNDDSNNGTDDKSSNLRTQDTTTSSDFHPFGESSSIVRKQKQDMIVEDMYQRVVELQSSYKTRLKLVPTPLVRHVKSMNDFGEVIEGGSDTDTDTYSLQRSLSDTFQSSTHSRSRSILRLSKDGRPPLLTSQMSIGSMKSGMYQVYMCELAFFMFTHSNIGENYDISPGAIIHPVYYYSLNNCSHHLSPLVHTIVSFSEHVEVVEDVVQYKRPFPIFNLCKLQFWNTSKVIHVIVLSFLMLIVGFQASVIGVQWNRWHCNRRGLVGLFFMNMCTGAILMALVLGKTIHRFTLDCIVNRKIYPNTSSSTSNNDDDDEMADDEKGKTAAAIYYRRLKNADFRSPLHFRAVRIFRALCIVYWIICRILTFLSLIYIIDIGDCVRRNKMMYFSNLAFFLLNILLAVCEVTVIIISVVP